MTPMPAWRWSPARPRATCWPACCSAACATRWPALAGGRHRRAEDGGAGLRRLVAAREAGGARLRRGAAPLPRDRRHPRRSWPSACWQQPPDALHRRRRARLQPRPGGAAASAAGIKTVHFVCPSIWAWRGERVREDRAQLSTTCCACSRSSRRCCAQHGVAATYVGHPLADAIPLRAAARRRRAALGLARRRRRRRAAARQPALARSSTSRRASCRPRRCMHAQRPDLRFVLPVAPGLRALVEPLVAQARAGVPIAAARRPLARGARGLRRDADRQRHRHAGSGAVQAADGDRLQHALR